MQTVGKVAMLENTNNLNPRSGIKETHCTLATMWTNWPRHSRKAMLVERANAAAENQSRVSWS